MSERGARWRVLRVLLEYSLSLTVTQNEHIVDPRGEPDVLCFGYRLGTGVPPWGSPPHPGPAVHRYGHTALYYAASTILNRGNRRIVRLLVDANADVHAQDGAGCAVSAATNRRSVPAQSPPPSAVQAHAAAPCRGQSPFRCHRRGAAAARRRRGRPGQLRVTLRFAAQPKPKPQQPRARRQTPKQLLKQLGKLAQYEAGESQVHSRPPPHSPPPRCWCRRIRRRYSPSAFANPAGREATQHSHCNTRPCRAPRRALLHPRVEV
jgi:hypothetical protein